MNLIVGRTLKGQTKSIKVDDYAVTIIPKALYHGFVGEKRIPYSSITAVQFKEGGNWLAGFIQFSIKGGNEWQGQVNQDENALQFDSNSNDDFRELQTFVQEKAGDASSDQIGSMADEITKLSTLRDQGILTEEEFEVQKTKLLK